MREETIKLLKANRNVMRTTYPDDAFPTPQEEHAPAPSLQVERHGEPVVRLPKDYDELVQKEFTSILKDRKSHRKYKKAPLSLRQLAYLLWATQGVKSVSKDKVRTTRIVPSAGGRQAVETYVLVNNVEDLPAGLYHYLPLSHALEFLGAVEDSGDRFTAAMMGQPYVAMAAVTFLWTAVPYRCEWRYTNNAQKFILLDAGHLCQNLYLACEALGLGTCAIGAYDQAQMDALLGVDGEEELFIYGSPVGVV